MRKPSSTTPRPKNYRDWIGRYVKKIRRNDGKAARRFKSGQRINRVKGIIDHPILHIPAFTFKEDDSYVECRRCELVVDRTGTL